MSYSDETPEREEGIDKLSRPELSSIEFFVLVLFDECK